MTKTSLDAADACLDFVATFLFFNPSYTLLSLCVFCIVHVSVSLNIHIYIYIWMWTIFRWISISIYIHPFFAGLIVFLSYSSSSSVRRRDDLGVTRNTPQRISQISDIGYQRISREYLGVTRNPQRISRISENISRRLEVLREYLLLQHTINVYLWKCIHLVFKPPVLIIKLRPVFFVKWPAVIS